MSRTPSRNVRPADIKPTRIMRAAAIDRFGPPSVLRLHTLPAPRVGPRDVLIAVHAAGVGVWDADMRDGSWRPFGQTKFPVILGLDGAGVVARTGSRVRRLREGDRVWAVKPAAGFYAEFLAVNADHVGTVPSALDLTQAGAGIVTALTALQGIDRALRLRPRETVLVFGATGAVGTLAIQFAKRRRARVIATATGREATRLVRRLGADAVIDGRHGDPREQLRRLLPDGLDAVLALAGGDALERCLDLVRRGGRVAYPNGVEPEPRSRPTVRMRSYDGESEPRDFAELNRAVVETRLRVPIDSTYTLARAAQAHRRLQRGHILGRIVLRIRQRD